MSGYEYDDDLYYTDGYKYDPVKLKNAILTKGLHPIYDPERIWKYLNQKKVWVNAYREEIKLSSIDKGYLFNILKWANANIGEISFTLTTAMDLGLAPTGSYTLSDFPLMAEIRKRYIKLAQKESF